MKNQLLRLLFVFAIIFTSVSFSLAWDDTGHKLVSYIAWQQMSPKAREEAVKLLLSAPEDSDISVFYLQDSRSEIAKQRELFMIAGTWADIVRDKKFKTRFAKYHHGTWHYLDTFWRETNGKVEIVSDLKSDEENALERIVTFDKVLRDNSASDEDKAIALAWILHLVGDIHQPLHDSGRVTDVEPKGDQGGNLFLLSPKDATGEDRLNLHWYWDSIIGRNVPRFYDACDSDYILPIAQEIMNKFPYSKMQNRLESGQFDKWQQEGFQIASTKLYPPTLIRFQSPSEAYKKQAFQIAQEQIALAGYRLGQMLNQIFDNQSAKVEQSVLIPQITTSGNDKSTTDSWLWTKIRASLALNKELDTADINIDVKDSVVTLNGIVRNKYQLKQAVESVQNIEGVKAVKILLKTKPKI